jgi:hypothetical protein
LWSSLTFLFATHASAQDATAGRPWSVRFGVQEAVDSNVNFVASGRDSDLVSELHGGLDRDWSFGRGSIKLTGDIAQNFYRTFTRWNHFTYSLGVTESYQLSRRATLRLRDTFSARYARDTTSIGPERLLFATALTRINSAGGEFAYDLSPRTQFNLALHGDTVSFASSGPLQLRGGSTYGTRLSIVRQINRDNAFGFVQEYQYTRIYGENGAIQALLGTWAGRFGRALSIAAQAGARAYSSESQRGLHAVPGGSVTVAGQLGRRNKLVLKYERTVEQAFGLGRTLLSETVVPLYDLNVVGGLTFHAAGQFVRSADPNDPTFRYTSLIGSAQVRYALVQDLAVVVDYRPQQFRLAPALKVSSYRSGVSLTYGRTWR